MTSQVARDPRNRAPFPNAHVLVIDDDKRLCAQLKQLIECAGYRVTAVYDAGAARALLKMLRFDLMVVDVTLPGESGLSLVEAMRRGLQTPVLMLSALGEANARIVGLRVGADDYMAKPFLPSELLLRMRSILQRAEADAGRAEPPGMLSLGDARYHVARGELQREEGKIVPLTGSEAQLMRVFARRPGQAISRETLFAELREGIGRGNERTIDVRITRLRRKIEPDSSNPRYLKTVRGVGYMLVPDP